MREEVLSGVKSVAEILKCEIRVDLVLHPVQQHHRWVARSKHLIQSPTAIARGIAARNIEKNFHIILEVGNEEPVTLRILSSKTTRPASLRGRYGVREGRLRIRNRERIWV